MTYEYLVRAKVDYEGNTTCSQLPRTFGEFSLDMSPNSLRYYYDLGQIDPTQLNDQELVQLREHKSGYPVSPLHIDFHLEVQDRSSLYSEADRKIQRLETLLRLFQKGAILLERQGIWIIEQDKFKPLVFLPIGPSNEGSRFTETPEQSTRLLADMVDYDLNDETLDRFVEFFNKYWLLISEAKDKLDVVFQRFNMSYGDLTDGKRFIDLMIAMEAIFGERGRDVGHKIAARSTCFIYALEEAREEAYDDIRILYNKRNNLEHGSELDIDIGDHERIDWFEDHVRKSITKWLDYHVTGENLYGRDFQKFVPAEMESKKITY